MGEGDGVDAEGEAAGSAAGAVALSVAVWADGPAAWKILSMILVKMLNAGS